MWVLATIVLVIVVAIITVVGAQQRSLAADRVTDLLRALGDDGIRPATVEKGIDRLEARLLGAELDRAGVVVQLTSALHRITTGAVVVNADGSELFRNDAAQPYAAGRHGDAVVEESIRARLNEALHGKTGDEELSLHGPPERNLYVVGQPLIERGELVGAIALVDDVTEQYRVDAVRRDFVANVSHELRTPVGALSLLTETLIGEQDPEIIERFAGRIHDETVRLAHLIDHLLALSHIDGGVREMQMVDVTELVAQATATCREHANVNQQQLSVEISQDVSVLGDQTQLTSAVTNLVANAVKYTPEEGTIDVRVVVHGREVAITVEDTGDGIAQKDQHRVFERFYRVDRGRSSDTGGTGLGLSIVRHVAANHGGRVELVSQEGVGSTFSLILPIAPETEPSESLSSADSTDG